MKTELNSHDAEEGRVPAVLLLAEASKPVKVSGDFDLEQQTWSNRQFDCASTKKHNEAM